MNQAQWNIQKLQFIAEVLDGVTGGPVANVPRLIPRILQLMIAQLQVMGYGGGFA